LALRNAMLYGEAEQRRRAAEELARTARTLSDRHDPKAVAQAIQQSVLAVFDVSSCNIWLLRPDGGLEALVASTCEAGHVQPRGIGLSTRPRAEVRAVCFSHLVNEPCVPGSEGSDRGNSSTLYVAALAVPLLT